MSGILSRQFRRSDRIFPIHEACFGSPPLTLNSITTFSFNALSANDLTQKMTSAGFSRHSRVAKSYKVELSFIYSMLWVAENAPGISTYCFSRIAHLMRRLGEARQARLTGLLNTLPEGSRSYLFNQELPTGLSMHDLLCGNFPGVNEYVRDNGRSREISVVPPALRNPHVITAGEVPPVTMSEEEVLQAAVPQAQSATVPDRDDEEDHVDDSRDNPLYSRLYCFKSLDGRIRDSLFRICNNRNISVSGRATKQTLISAIMADQANKYPDVAPRCSVREWSQADQAPDMSNAGQPGYARPNTEGFDSAVPADRIEALVNLIHERTHSASSFPDRSYRIRARNNLQSMRHSVSAIQAILESIPEDGFESPQAVQEAIARLQRDNMVPGGVTNLNEFLYLETERLRQNTPHYHNRRGNNYLINAAYRPDNSPSPRLRQTVADELKGIYKEFGMVWVAAPGQSLRLNRDFNLPHQRNFGDIDSYRCHVAFVTPPMTLRHRRDGHTIEVNFGRFLVGMRMDAIQIGTGTDYVSNVMMAMPYDAPVYADGNSGGYIHPHISGGRFCLGESPRRLSTCLRNGLIYDAAQVITQLTGTYNNSSPYITLSHFDTNNYHQCMDCGQTFREDEMHSCIRPNGSSAHICDECVVNIDTPDGDTVPAYRGDLTTCPHCNRTNVRQDMLQYPFGAEGGDPIGCRFCESERRTAAIAASQESQGQSTSANATLFGADAYSETTGNSGFGSADTESRENHGLRVAASEGDTGFLTD